MRLPVEVVLELPDGCIYTIHHDVAEEYADGQYFWWTEGNGGCDCNRSLFLNREHNLGLIDKDEDDCLGCGDSIKLVELIVNGKRVYDEREN